MKNAVKTLWLIIAGLFVLGLLLVMIGVGFGATRHLRTSARGIELVPQKTTYYQKNEPNAQAFSKVEITLPATWVSVTFEQSDHYGYAINIPVSESYRIRDAVEGGALKLGLEGTSKNGGDLNFNWPDLNFALSGWTKGEKGRIVVYTPREARLDTIKLDFAAGSYEVGPLDAREVQVSCPAGEVTIGKITADNVNLALTAGSMHVTGIDADTVNASLTAGELYTLETSANVVSLSSTTGEIRFSGDAKKRLGVTTTTGEATVELARPRDDYAVTADTAMGDIEIDGVSARRLHESDPGRTQVNASATVGHIGLKFSKG